MITQTEPLIINTIMRKPNPIIVLLCILLTSELGNKTEITILVGTRHIKGLGSRPWHHGQRCKGI